MQPIFAHGQGIILFAVYFAGFVGVTLMIVSLFCSRSIPERPFARKIFWMGGGLSFLLCALLVWPAALRETRPASRLQNLQSFGLDLRTGMSKAEVLQILGKPDNDANEPVWFWNTERTSDRRESWTNYYMGDGLFVVFHGELLASPLLKSSESDPWDALRASKGISQSEVEHLLGAKPKIVHSE